MWSLLRFSALLSFGIVAFCQQSQPSAELETKDAPAKFTSRVNLVPLTVVVRDSKGQAVGNLKKEDFRLLDNGKPQVITRFSIEKPGAAVVIEKDAAEVQVPTAPAGGAPEAPGPVIADHFVAYLFDDVHLRFEDLARARDAAGKLIATSMQTSDRAAIYTTSGQIMQEFTNDQAKLQATLLRLRPVSLGVGGSRMDCPSISYYMADLIANKNDPQAVQVALVQYQQCSGNQYAKATEIYGYAQQALSVGTQAMRLATTTLVNVIRRIAAMPGQRSIILTSPGFFIPFDYQQEVTDAINRAIRANVIVSSLDARGLWTPPGFSAAQSTPMGGPMVLTMLNQYARMEASTNGDVLAELADGTGGGWFHDNNDLQEGFRRLAAAPEFIYVLGFTPENLKSDGKFHKLSVSLVEIKGLSLQARRGYYAPKREAGVQDQAKQEIEDAVFSREVMKDIPLELHTQFFKSSDMDAKLSVMAHVDVKALRYRREDGRNRNDLTVVAALFDPNGNYVAAIEKTVQFRLKDETLEKRLNSGITIKSTFDVKIGSYVVRLVVRDSEGQLMAAENGSVQIP
jgi:VWFA-related protein